MASNLALYIMQKADVNKEGSLNLYDLEEWQMNRPAEYEILEDLFNLAPDFLTKYKHIFGPGQGRVAQHAPASP